MRILMVSEDIPNPHLGGLGKHALNLANALAARGHDVDLLGSAKHPLSAHPEQHGPGRFFGELIGYERGWKQQRLGLFHAYAIAANAKPVRDAILRRAPGYDVVHYHGHLPWLAADIPASLPFVQTRHDQGGDCMLKTRYIDDDGPRAGICQRVDASDCAACASTQPTFWQRQISRHAVVQMRELTRRAYERHTTVFVAAFLKRNFERAVGQPVSGQIVPNAVDTDQLAEAVLASGALASPTNRLRLFAAGAMFAYKGFGPLLAAITSSAVSQRRDFQLRLAGSGPLEAPLRQQYAGGTVEFLGWCAYSKVVAEVLAADAVIVPSVWEEPCATSILEALAMGKTVYALDAGGTPEMAAYASSAGGRLRTFSSLDALADAVLRHDRVDLTTSPAQPAKFENNVERMAEHIEAVYLDLIAAKQAVRA